MYAHDAVSINSQQVVNIGIALVDIKARNEAALEEYKDFFLSNKHTAKVERATEIINAFFKSYGRMYFNYRPNRGNPMTVIKISHPTFPNELSPVQKKIAYYDPLTALGVEIVFSKNTNSYLYRIS